MPKGRIGGKGSKKIGRNKVKCEKYISRHTREKNRDTRMKRKLKELNKRAKQGVEYKIKNNKIGTNEIINIIKIITPEEVRVNE